MENQVAILDRQSSILRFGLPMRRFLNRTISKLYGALPWLARRWAEKARLVESRDVPWTQLRKPLGSCRVALITTGGLHLRRDPPFDMSDPQGDPTYREIPVTASAADLTITHDYYDHRDADRDFNIVFPLDRFRELVSRGIVGALTPVHFSFMGHIDGPHIRTLQEHIAPQLVQALKRMHADVAFLTPA